MCIGSAEIADTPPGDSRGRGTPTVQYPLAEWYPRSRPTAIRPWLIRSQSKGLIGGSRIVWNLVVKGDLRSRA